jgi:hypothetical protein
LIDTGEMTSYLIARLSESFSGSGVLVGDGVAPDAGGWTEGTPNTVGGFVPYIVISTTSPTSSTMLNTPLCTTLPVRLDIPYVLASYQNTRADADAVAAAAREYLKNLPAEPVQLGDLKFRSHDVWVDSLTGAIRNDSTHPKMWSANTNFHVGVARVSG